jgi:transmembrane serine protease 11D
MSHSVREGYVKESWVRWHMEEVMKVSSITARAGISLCCFLGFATAGYSQTPEAATARLEALKANPQAAAIARGAAGRIVGGDPVLIGDNPWQVALIRGTLAEPQRSQFCGGSVIGNEWILTAAHCIKSSIVREDPTRVNVVVGTPQFFIGGERLAVAAVHVHPQYNDQTNDFDFALLRLSRSVATGGTAATRPVELASATTQVSDGAAALVTGWGAVSEGSPGSLDLLGVEIPVVSNAVCNRPESYNGDITANMMCAGRETGGVDSCQGDSGGPLTAMLDGRRLLVGVVSWGEGCARRLKYGVYARVPAASSWIASVTGLSVSKK